MSFVARTVSLHRPNYYVNEDPSAILFNRHFNKGTAFTLTERTALKVRGLLPHCVEDISKQVRRCLMQLRSFDTPISKYNYLASLRERSDTLFYRLVIENLRECLPIIYTPTVGQACLEFGLQYRAAEGMYISQADKNNIRHILDNWRPNTRDEVAIIVITDGSRILGLGDLGANGMGIPIGKASLYVAAAGFHPASTLPIVLDVGTNNEALLEDEFYLGARHKRLPDEQYYPLIDELMMAIKDKWPQALLQFEDFSNDHCFELLDRYRRKLRCFNDDIQGTGAVIAAGFLSAVEMAGLPNLEDHRIVVLGAGSAGIGVVNTICAVLAKKFKLDAQKAKKMFYLLDIDGIIAVNRPFGAPLKDFVRTYAREDISDADVANLTNLEAVVEFVKPTGLIGLSGAGRKFTPEILKSLLNNTERPIVFPLSNPTSAAECTAQDAFYSTNGKCIFASGSPFPIVTLPDGSMTIQPSQGNNMYIFPGLGFGAWLVGATEVSDGMIIESAIALADLTTEEQRAKGEIYPPLEEIRDISKYIAARVIQQAVREGLVPNYRSLPADVNSLPSLIEYIADNMYDPSYLEWNSQTGTVQKSASGMGAPGIKKSTSLLLSAALNKEDKHHPVVVSAPEDGQMAEKEEEEEEVRELDL